MPDVLTEPKSKPTRKERAAEAAALFFLPYQKRWIEDESRMKLAEKSRQIGWTWSEANRRVKKAAVKGAHFDAWISSRDEIQARLFLDDCAKFARVYDVGARDLGEQVIDKPGDVKAQVLEFASGRKINSMSSNPDAQAGKRGDRTLDEFALHKDGRKLFAIAHPGILWGGQMSIFSTHRGDLNFFNQLVTEAREGGNKKGFSLHRVTIEDAVRDGLLAKIQAKVPDGDPRKAMTEDEFLQSLRDECADEESWMQEFMCVPADDASALLMWDWIIAAEYKKAEWEAMLKRPLSDAQGRLYAGYDVARKKDRSVVWIAEEFGGMLLTRQVHVMERVKFSEQKDLVWRLMKAGGSARIQRLAIDATGMGMQMAEECREAFGEYRVQEVTFTPASKQEMAFPLRGRFEDRTFKMPEDKWIRADFRCIKKEETAGGNLLITAERNEGGHADRFWAAALCNHAAMTAEDPGMFARFTSLLRNRRSDRSRSRARRARRGLG